MVINYKPMQIKEDVLELLGDCEFIYRQYHPELNEVYLSKSKILYEVFKFYLQKTTRAVKE